MPKFYKPVFKVLRAGVHDIEIVAATQKVTRSGKDMTVLDVKAPGTSRFKDWLFWDESSRWKVKQCLIACGMQREDGCDVEAEEFVGRRARALIGVKQMEDGATFNHVEKWLPPEVLPAPAAVTCCDDGEGAEAPTAASQNFNEGHNY